MCIFFKPKKAAIVIYENPVFNNKEKDMEPDWVTDEVTESSDEMQDELRGNNP